MTKNLSRDTTHQGPKKKNLLGKLTYQVEEEGYTQVPSDQFNITRFLNSEAPWKNPRDITVNKIIVINIQPDFTLDEIQFQVIKNRLQALSAEFEIYVSYGNLLTSFEQLEPYEQFTKFSYYPDKNTLYKIASTQLRLSHEAVFIFGEEQLTQLLLGDEGDWYDHYQDNALLLVHSPIHPSTFSKLLQKHAQEIRSIVIQGAWQLLSLELPPDLILPKLERLVITHLGQDMTREYPSPEETQVFSEKVAEQLITASPNLSCLEIDFYLRRNSRLIPNFSLLENVENPEKLQILSFTGRYNGECLQRVLSGPLTSLSLNLTHPRRDLLSGAFVYEFDLGLLANKPLQKLCFKEISFSGSSFSKNLLQNAKHLEELTLIKCAGPVLFAATATEIQLSIKKLTIISSYGFLPLLNLCPNLEKLLLKGDKLNNFQLKTDKFPALQSLRLETEDSNSQVASKIVQQANNLQYLNLSYNRFVTLDNLPSSKILKEIHLKNIDLSPEQWQFFLEEARQLEVISLTNTNVLLTAPIHAPRLKEVTVATISSSASLFNLCNNNPLKKLSIKHVLLENHPFDLSNLTCFEVVCSQVSLTALINLLKNSPLLRNITLTSNTQYTQDEKHSREILLQLPQFNYLSTMEFRVNSLDPRLISILLARAPHLKRVGLTDGFITLDSPPIITDLPLQCNAMQSFSLVSDLLAPENLTTLLRSAKQLNTLYLSRYSPLLAVEFDTCHFPALTWISLDEIKLNLNFLAKLTQCMPFLKQLVFQNVESVGELFKTSLAFSELIKCAIYVPKASSLHLLSWLKMMPQLQELTIQAWNEEGYGETFVFQLHHLRSLRLANCSFSAKTFGNLLRSAPNLEELSLQNVKVSLEKIEPLALKKLIKLYLYNDDLTRNLSLLLQSILQKAVNLKELEVFRGTIEDEIAPLNLPNLTILKLKAIKLSHENFEKIIQPQLINLEVTKPTLVGKGFSNRLNLVHLEKLQFEVGLSINWQDILSLITQAPQLKFLTCSTGPWVKVLYCNPQFPLKNIEMVNGVMGDGFSDCIDEMKKIASSPSQNQMAKLALPINNATPPLPEKRATNIPRLNSETSYTEPHSINADTHYNPQTQLSANVVFFGQREKEDPAVNAYRLRIFDHLALNPSLCSINDCFTLKKKKTEPSWIEITAPKNCAKNEIGPYFSSLSHHSYSHYYGKIDLQPSFAWQVLPSLSANEKLIAYASDTLLEIRYCQEDNVYWVRVVSLPNKPISFEFILQVPPQKSLGNLPQDIREKIEECRKYKSLDLKLVTNMRGKDYLQALANQKTGACRHRSVVFFHWLTENYPALKARIIVNDVHAFVEIYYQDQWSTCDLGGYSFDKEIELKRSHSRPASSSNKQIMEKTESLCAISPEEKQSEDEAAFNQPLENPSTLSYFSKNEHPKYLASPSALLSRALNYSGHALLIHTQAPDELRDALQKACKTQGYPFIVIDAAHELITSAPFIKPFFEENKCLGMIMPGPGGRLHDFLLKAPKNLRIIVNFDRFSPKEIAKFNKLIEAHEPMADSTPLPNKSLIIGVQNPQNPDAYLKEDFISRFAKPKPWVCPFTAADFADHESPFSPPTTEAYTLEFFNQDGIEKFTGSWEFYQDRFLYVEGDFSQALKTHSQIILSNAPWHNRDFRRFWHEMVIHRRFLLPNGQQFIIDPSIRFSQQKGYEWSKLVSVLTSPSKAFSWFDVVLVHQNNFRNLFKCYEYQPDLQTLMPTEGRLNLFKNSSCSLYVSTPLSMDSWAKLFTYCQKLNIALTVYYAAQESLPEELSAYQSLMFPAAKPISDPLDCCVFTNDRDYALEKLAVVSSEDKLTDIVIDISEEDPSLVLGYLKPTIEAQLQRFRLRQKLSPLSGMLEHYQRVILLGRFKPAMVDSLNDLLLQRYQNRPEKPFQLIIIDEQSSSWLPLVEQRFWPLDLETKKRLCPLPSLHAHYLEQYSLSQLIAINNFQQRMPGEPPEKAWYGLESLEPEKNSSTNFIEFSEAEAEAVSAQFYQDRFNLLHNQFTHHRMAVISGKTGIGKTGFMLGFWRKTYPALHIGIKALKNWAKDEQKDGFIVLLLDEANTEGLDWSRFESFLKLGMILINNKIYQLKPNHRICFLINPNNHGHRTTPSLFQRHGHCLLFSPFPVEFIYHEILRPILQSAKVADRLTVVKPLLQVAHFFNQLDDGNLLISAREFSMMLLLSLSYQQRQANSDLASLVSYYAWAIANPLVPALQKSQFDALWPVIPKLTINLPAINSLVVNEANQTAARFVWDILQLREYRATQPPMRGGIYRLNLMGEPGIGKSELVQALVQAQGLSPSADNPLQKYYFLPASLSRDLLQEKIKNAAQEGALVIIDEINTAALSEEFMNNLEENVQGFKSSFFLLGTLNPPEKMAGRKLDSIATERRTIAVNIRNYQPQEMAVILRQKNLPEKTITSLIADYLRHVSAQNNLCFRDLNKKASKLAYQQIKTEWESILDHLQKRAGIYQKKGQTNLTKAFTNLRKNLINESELFRLGSINFITFKTNCLAHKKKTLSQLPKSLSMLDVFIKIANFFATVFTLGIANCLAGHSALFRAPPNEEEVFLNGIDYGLGSVGI